MRRPKQKIKLKELARIVSGTLHGEECIEIRGINTLENAASGDLSFYSGPRYKKELDKTEASCILVPRGFKYKIPLPYIETDNVDLALKEVADTLHGKKIHPVKDISRKSSISPLATLESGVKVGDYTVIEENVRVGKNSVIYPGVYIGPNSSIGKDSVIYPGAVIMDSVKIGNEVMIHPGAVIGSDGFGYTRKKKRFIKTSQRGGVTIGNGVEVGANTAVDRGSFSDTMIGEGTKIDNLVQIAHNVRLGENCRIVSQTGISGSTKVDDEVVLAGQSGVVGHIKIGRGVIVGAQAGVTKDVKEGEVVSGYPAEIHRKAKRINALVKKLPSLYKKVEKLGRKIDREE